MITKDEEAEIYTEMYRDIRQYELEQSKLKNEYKKKLKGLINVKALFDFLNDGQDWAVGDIVEIVLTDEKLSGYPNYQHARIVNDPDRLLYMKTSFDEANGIDYYYCWQTSGMTGDDYSGFILFPLSDGKFFKVSYSC